MNIREAMTDPETFGPHFRGDSWRAWGAFLDALFALPMDDEALATYRRHTGRQELPAAPFKEATLVCGRRAGKSRIMAFVAVYLATFRDYAPYLAPGEVATVAVMASDKRQARTIFNYVKGAFETVPMLTDMLEDETKEQLTLSNRVVIEISTASYRGTRGYTYAAVLADETAFWRTEETSANPDEEIIAAIRPGLSSIPSSVLLIASSPYAKRGVLWTNFRKHFGRDGARVLVWKASTAEMNPKRDAALEAEAYEEDSARASAEWGGNFRDDVAAFVTAEAVDGRTMWGRLELPRLNGTRYAAFVDPSGGTRDSMTLGIAHTEKSVAVLDAVREVKPPFSPEGTVEEFCAFLKTYGLSSVTGDRYAGEWPREQFRKHGIAYELSDKPKSDIYRDLLPLLNSGRCELLDLPRIRQQLTGLERRTARGGRDSIDHGPGAHDDLANAVAGALLKAGAGSGYDSSMDWVGDGLGIPGFRGWS